MPSFLLRLLSLLIAIAVFLASPAGAARGVTNVDIGKVQAKSVGATIRDTNGDAVAGAEVVEFSADWKTQIRSTTTNSEGRFLFTPVSGRTIYWIRVLAKGFNPLQFRLSVNPKQKKELMLELSVAT